ncbi:hypothetical protein PMIN01_07932 [Paraphaeosphaeria minitans]|uniref:Uncharacterized protein n=1 Tax=Paraphaeosphaeria minitans TaxID=565426 RepID=A0A9P6GDU2_9PLEO|nr:hypothetical protein PMIN01_07932 [Paraphaeosphaeria minitans]
MKLGPPTLTVTAEYFHRIVLRSHPHFRQDIQFLRRMQDDASWPRLRISEQDRANKSLEDQKILMWARILQLNLLSEKCIRIGVFVGKQAQESGDLQFLNNLAKQLERIMAIPWWRRDCRHVRPIYQIRVEWECVMFKDVIWPIVPQGCIVEAITWDRGTQREVYALELLSVPYKDWTLLTGTHRNTLTLATKGYAAFERKGEYIRERSTGRKIAWIPHNARTRAHQQSGSRKTGSRSQISGSQQKTSRSRSSGRGSHQASRGTGSSNPRSRIPGRAPSSRGPRVHGASSTSAGSSSRKGRRR